MTQIDLNSDLGESYGPWVMGNDEEVLSLVTSANVACGGHASDMKPHGAIANVACDDETVATALTLATKAVDRSLPILAISGTVLETVAQKHGMQTYAEIFADRAYTSKGRLVSRARPDAMVTDPEFAARRLVEFMKTGLMPTVDGGPIKLKAESICVHGDSAHAVGMARKVRQALEAEGITLKRFVD